MKILAFLGIGIVVTLLSMNLMDNMKQASERRASMSRNSEATDALIDAGQAIRMALETHERNPAGCPAGTAARTLSGRPLCWPMSPAGGGGVDLGRDGDCFSSKYGINLCLWFGAPVASNRRTPSLLQEFSIFPEAVAQSYFTNRSPASGGVAGGVRLIIPSCGDPGTTPCIDCANAANTCFTVVFCVDRSAPCPDRQDQWIQTIAFRRFL